MTKTLQDQNSRPQYPFDSVALRKFVVLRLYQFKLNNRFDPDDIIHDIYLRLDKQLTAGKCIPNVDAWLRGAAHNRIREISRKCNQETPFEPSMLEDTIADKNESLDLIAHEHLREAMQLLSEEQRDLLIMRFYGGMSWESISEVLSSQGRNVLQETLRKQGQRAIEKLRRLVLEKVRE